MFLKLANADINYIFIACLLNGRKHRIVITRSCTNLMIKAQQDTDTNKSKPPETSTWHGLHLYALLSHQNLSVIAPIFLKSLSVKLPDGMSRRSFQLVCEILRVHIFVRVFFILSIRNLDLQSGVCCIK